MSAVVLDRLRVARLTGGTLVIALSVGAWVALVAWSASPYERFLDHETLVESSGAATGVWLFVAAWVVMLAAMMLPSTHELVSVFATVVSGRPDRRVLLGVLLCGYLVVWTVVGLAALLGDQLVHVLVDRVGWLERNEWLIGAALVAAAGLYQFSPVKDRCLTACRSPRTFVFGRWRGRNALSEAFALGAGHGKFCVGCCLALMLLMFGIGMGNLAWMLALAAVMTVEKLARWGRRIVRPIGFVLPGVALVMVAVNV